MNTHYSIVLDKRRGNKNDLFPVRLRIYNSVLAKDKRYPLDVKLTEKEYKKIFYPIENERLSQTLKATKIKLNAYEAKAKGVIEKIDTFTFEVFERKYFRDIKTTNTVLVHYKDKISRLQKAGKVGTADSYQCSLNSIEKFLNEKNKKLEALRLAEINKRWLEDYEQYMLNEKKSKTTIGIYLRPLQHIFNNAIELKDISIDYYPFGKRGYTIPKGGGVKKALNQSQLSKLFYAEPQIPQQQKAKDFWFLSYALNGMNIQDLAVLKFRNLYSDRIEFIREKTKDTNKGKKQITTYLNEYSTHIIDKYKCKNGKPNAYVFEIIEKGMTPEQIKSKVKNFTRFLNQHIKDLAEDNELPKDISTYWARHTFATMSVNKGASLEFMSEALGHTDLKTTQTYFAGFTNETKKDFAKELMNF